MTITAIRTHDRPARRALGLIRVSMEKDGGTSPDIQRRAIQGYADSHNIRIVDWVEGVDEKKYSGSRAKSKWWPKLEAAVDRIESGEVDMIVVWRFSRTARNRLKWAATLDRVDMLGGELVSALEPIEVETASGKLHRGMMGEFNAYYSDMMSESWKETHDRRRRAGLTHNGGPRFGYVRTEDGRYEVDPETGSILAEIYRRYISGQGFARIARWLNEVGAPRENGAPWNRVPVTHMLDAGFGAGKIIQRLPRKDGSYSMRIDEAIYHDGIHEAVITPEEWEAYVAKRSDAPRPSRGVAGRYMLTSIVFCGHCGAPLHPGNEGGKHYRCSRNLERRDVPFRSMTRTLVEQVVADWVQEQASDVERLATELAKRQERKVVKFDNVETLDKKIASLKDQLGRITVRWSAGKLSDSAYDSASAQLEDELEALRVRRVEAIPRARVEVDPTKLLIRLAEYWGDLTPEEANRILVQLIRGVYIDKPSRLGTGVWRERVRIVPVWAPEDTVGANWEA